MHFNINYSPTFRAHSATAPGNSQMSGFFDCSTSLGPTCRVPPVLLFLTSLPAPNRQQGQLRAEVVEDTSIPHGRPSGARLCQLEGRGCCRPQVHLDLGSTSPCCSPESSLSCAPVGNLVLIKLGKGVINCQPSQEEAKFCQKAQGG